MKVVIAGSGLVGAATALALSQQGHECVMYDQVNLAEAIQKANGGVIEPIDFGETGGAVTLNSSALRVLQTLGVLDEVIANSIRTPFIKWFKIDGSSPIALDVATVAGFCGIVDKNIKCGVQILRAKLHDILVRAAFKAGTRTFVGKKIVDVFETESDVTAVFADGTSATGDFLIGADGIHSATRRAVFGKELKAQYTGMIGYIGVVNIGEHNIKLEEVCAFYVGTADGQFVCSFKISDTVAAVQVMTLSEPDAEESNDDTYRPYSDLPKHAERLADMIQGWGVPAHLVQMMRKSHRISPSSIYDLPDLETYHKERVMLIGDSAHGMIPAAGLGLATGLEDVGVLLALFEQLPKETALSKILELYSKIRVPQAAKNSEVSRMGQVHKKTMFGGKLNHVVLRLGVFALNHNWLKFADFVDCPLEVSKAIAEGEKAK
ncbi:hypothetical protein HDU98_000028 [Podochytrium sp. JEL0797]|nr:hypothetical protein HDU98_000028 [Podochytrium sp. JEL0797]